VAFPAKLTLDQLRKLVGGGKDSGGIAPAGQNAVLRQQIEPSEPKLLANANGVDLA
jgi:hypothetical protein